MTTPPFSAALTRAWLLLIALSLGSAVITLIDGLPKLTGTAILLLALAKSRVILSRYLGLDQAPGLRRGFTVVLSLFGLVILVLYIL